MTEGAIALVLHAHLPYVRSAEPGSLEEDWFFQALIECYLPLLETLEQADADPACQPKVNEVLLVEEVMGACADEAAIADAKARGIILRSGQHALNMRLDLLGAGGASKLPAAIRAVDSEGAGVIVLINSSWNLTILCPHFMHLICGQLR